MNSTPPPERQSRLLAKMAGSICRKGWDANPGGNQSRSPVRRLFTKICSSWEGETRKPYQLRLATCEPTMCELGSCAGHFIPSRIPANLAMTPGPRMHGNRAEPRITGPEWHLMRNAACYMCQRAQRHLISMVRIDSAMICSRTVLSPWMLKPEGGF